MFIRDVSGKLGRNLSLVPEGEETAADKNTIEVLAGLFIHRVGNSLG
jgi:two-component system, chemotaxis family, sensor kinase CheA